ncbi:hypothetical protein HanIR_Chr11g0511651 [Helianthus annuus]|nr:hypothetical protein HanIR_Chr11g0511611 [Helianthus annuus]KAJ0507932.1 hypothetical protein HanIR_Chr11g0511651 [Helianthus annuus]
MAVGLYGDDDDGNIRDAVKLAASADIIGAIILGLYSGPVLLLIHDGLLPAGFLLRRYERVLLLA